MLFLFHTSAGGSRFVHATAHFTYRGAHSLHKIEQLEVKVFMTTTMPQHVLAGYACK
jgi:hypothetical protein